MAAVPPPGVHVTYRQQFVRCCKPACTACSTGRPSHGPYWYGYWREDGRKRSCYVGKQPPPLMAVSAAPPLPALRPPNWSALPRPPTSFVGREREVADLRRLLMRTPRRDRRQPHTASRLLTLTGADGSGKSRLALRAATEVRDAQQTEVRYLDLTALTDPALVASTVAAALGVPETPGHDWPATLASYLAQRRLLLVLDHCDHLRPACAALATALLPLCHNLRLLATSQEPLGAPGETVRLVSSLAVPLMPAPSPAQVAEAPSVSLFVERAAAALPGFALTDQSSASIAEVCRRLDGMPLAIELASARLAAMPVDELLLQLRRRFILLVGADAALPRQTTLRVTLDWSVGLLDEAGRQLLRRLAVFAGSWTLDAARQICGGQDIEARRVPSLLGDLGRMGLVRQRGSGRYTMEESVRAFVREQIDPAQAEALHTRHAAWYLSLAERAEAEHTGPNQARWLDVLQDEYDNLRAALAWPPLDGQGDSARLRLAAALRWFWDARGSIGEGRRRLERLLTECVAADAAIRARALAAAGDLAMRQADYDQAETLLKESLMLCRSGDDQAGVAVALSGLGNVATYREDLAGALALHEESLAIRRALGSPSHIAGALDNVADLERRRGDYALAAALYAECLDLARAAGDELRLGSALNGLGYLALAQRDHEAAGARFRESLVLQRALDDRFGMTFNLEGLAVIAVAQGQAERGAQLFGALEWLRAATGVPLQPAFAREHEEALTTLRAALDDAAVAAAWAAGGALTLEEALDLALA